ncbi:glycerophosphodiester phosphodiesterase [Streptomyces albiaxialis]
MVTKAILVSLVTLATAASSTAVATAVPTDPSSSDSATGAEALPKVVYTAHRGGALEVPENSMSGLTATFERGHAPVLDIDIRMLKDGTLVAMHDATLDRTTDSHGPVRALTLREWRKVRIQPSPVLSGRWPPEPPPTLREILDRFGGRTPLMLELKDPKGLDRLTTMLRSRKLTRSVYLNTNRLRLAVRAHRRGLLTAVWRSARQLPGDHPERWTRNVNILSVDHETPAPHIRRALRSGIHHIWAHTVNTPADRDRMLKHGVRGIVTDVPSLLGSRPAVRHPAAP